MRQRRVHRSRPGTALDAIALVIVLAILALEQFFKTDDRGMVALLRDWSDLRAALGLTKVPHPTTLFQARQRLAKKGSLAACLRRSSALRAGRCCLLRRPGR